MRLLRILAFVAALVAAAPVGWAAPWPEGRFVDADGASEVVIVPRDDGGVELTVTSPAFDRSLEVTLVPSGNDGVLEEPTPSRSWFARLMGDTPSALPFDGERMVFGRDEEGALVVTTLEVDGRGRPTLQRLALEPAGDGLRLRLRRFDESGVEVVPAVTLTREAS